jgi:hypothetical protein
VLSRSQDHFDEIFNTTSHHLNNKIQFVDVLSPTVICLSSNCRLRPHRPSSKIEVHEEFLQGTSEGRPPKIQVFFWRFLHIGVAFLLQMRLHSPLQCQLLQCSWLIVKLLPTDESLEGEPPFPLSLAHFIQHVAFITGIWYCSSKQRVQRVLFQTGSSSPMSTSIHCSMSAPP